jgi:hypothetical protein
LSTFLNPATTVGVIVLGVIAGLITSLIWLSGKRMAPRLRDWGRRFLPNWAYRSIGRVVLWLRPSLRSLIGSVRRKEGLGERLAILSTRRRPKIVIIGGVYLDATLTPIRVDRLDGVTEYSDLTRLEWKGGGTAYYLAHYLRKYHSAGSYLFTRKGDDDTFSRELERKLKGVEGYILDTEGEQCGVSIHLRHEVDADSEVNSNLGWTTFTHKGALANLTWSSVMRRLQRKTEGPSILYISSYFRTGLWQNLTGDLQKISSGAVVCVNHGRYMEGENRVAVNELIKAFKKGQVDVYICTLRELECLIKDYGRSVQYRTIQEFLRALAFEDFLPRITVVRHAGNEKAIIYYVIDKTVYTETGQGPGVDHPGENGAFSAGLVYGLCHAPEGQGIEATVKRAVKLAIEDYCRAATEGP